MVQKNKILLHACCGICSGYPISMLKENNFDISVYFYNPNLDTEEEFNKRLNAQKKVCEFFDTELISEPYNHLEYLNYIQGLESEPEKGKRCIKCIELRLDKTAKKAQELGIEHFATSLVISPHKNFEIIKEIADKCAEKYDIKYFDYNFRKKDGFLKTNKIAGNLNLYRQNYCGCEFAKTHLR